MPFSNSDSLRRRANARNVSFRISLRWPIHIINPVDEAKLSCYTSHRRSTTVSLETYPSIHFQKDISFVFPAEKAMLLLEESTRLVHLELNLEKSY